MTREAWMTKAEVAKELRVSVSTVDRMNLPRMKVGRQNRYLMSQVYAALNGVPAEGGNVVALRRRREEKVA